jgi:hypothetical protein
MVVVQNTFGKFFQAVQFAVDSTAPSNSCGKSSEVTGAALSNFYPTMSPTPAPTPLTNERRAKHFMFASYTQQSIALGLGVDRRHLRVI